jgi:protein gp37
MAQQTEIVWTKQTWNPIIGCTKISQGCKFCYAEKMANRLAANPKTSQSYAQVMSNGHWNGQTFLVEKQLLKPSFGEPCMVFVGSMTDPFHEATPFEWLDRVFAVIEKHPQHTFQILTKRPARMFEYFAKHPLPDNVWLGVTAENQAMAEERIPQLLRLDPRIAFVSIEPCLGAIDLSLIPNANLLDWVIVGGESGKNARPMHPDWVTAIHEYCTEQEITFFFKQWGEWLPSSVVDNELTLGIEALLEVKPAVMSFLNHELITEWKIKGRKWLKFYDGTLMCNTRGVKEVSGQLDGKTYHNFPEEKK